MQIPEKASFRHLFLPLKFRGGAVENFEKMQDALYIALPKPDSLGSPFKRVLFRNGTLFRDSNFKIFKVDANSRKSLI